MSVFDQRGQTVVNQTNVEPGEKKPKKKDPLVILLELASAYRCEVSCFPQLTIGSVSWLLLVRHLFTSVILVSLTGGDPREIAPEAVEDLKNALVKHKIASAGRVDPNFKHPWLDQGA